MQKKKAGWRYLAAATLAGAFLLSGIQANATENLTTQNYPVREESLTPLSNLAQGFPVFISSEENSTRNDINSTTREELKKIVDGKKYGSGSLHEGESVSIGNSDYVEIDLGASYNIEVINVKRTFQKTFHSTAIVIAENKDFSDGQVVYYQEGAQDKISTFSNNVTKAGASYQETYGGEWFYMDADGITPSAPQTVKKAQYIRVYSENPANDTTSGFVEIGVYGYQDETRMNEKRELRQINSKNPLIINSVYSSSKPYAGMEVSSTGQDLNEGKDLYVLGEEGPPEFKHGETIQGRWNAIPENIRDNNIILVHTDNLGMRGGTQWGNASSHKKIHERQELYQDFNERCLIEGYKNDIPMMLVAITASAVPRGTLNDAGQEVNGTFYNLCAAADLGWMDLMYRMYPNFEGTFNPENHWSYNFDKVAAASGMALEMAALHDGYFIWSESVDTLESAGVKNSQRWINAFKNHGNEHLYMIYKTTGAVGGGKEYSTTSYMQGMWLGGYAAGWGGLIDTWSWSNVKQGDYGSGGGGGWAAVAAYPEAMTGAQLVSLYLEGASVYTFEHPAVTNGVNDENTPMYDHVIYKCFDEFIKNPGPDKKEILEKTKLMIYGNIYANKGILDGLVGDTGRNYFLYDTGRYGVIPAVSDFLPQEEVEGRIRAFCQENGIESPTLISTADSRLNDSAAKIELFNQYYPQKYEGNAFADIWNNKWWIYNNEYDPNDVEATQQAVIDLRVDGTEFSTQLKTTLKAHSYLTVDTGINNESISLHLNNYRTNKSGLFNAGAAWDNKGWTGGEYSLYDIISYSGNNFSETPQGGGWPEDKSKEPNTYGYNGGNANLWCAGLWDFCEAYIQKPLDDEMRTTVFELTNLTESPRVSIINAQEWDAVNSNSPQINGNNSEADVIDVSYDSQTQKATITVNSNGWVDLEISGIKLGNKEPEVEVVRENMAQGAEVVMSTNSSPNDRPASFITDGIVNGNKDLIYAQTAAGAQWIQVNMENVYEVEALNLYRYWDGSRSYNDTIILLSSEENFAPEKTLVLFNSCEGQVAWPSLEGYTDVDFSNLAPATDSDYIETEEGKRFYVTEGLKMLDGSDATVGDQYEDITEGKFGARYIRIYSNGLTTNAEANNHFIEVVAEGVKETIVVEERPVELENIARDAEVTMSSIYSTDRPASRITDGVVEGDQDHLYTHTEAGAQWVEVNLNGIYEIDSVDLYRYSLDGRTYNDTIVLLSPDNQFDPDKTLVLFNSCQNPSIEWCVKENYKVVDFSQMAAASDSDYAEEPGGKTFKVGTSLKMLDGTEVTEENLANGRFKAGYVRVYSNGHSGDSANNNHFIEIEVNAVKNNE